MQCSGHGARGEFIVIVLFCYTYSYAWQQRNNTQLLCIIWARASPRHPVVTPLFGSHPVSGRVYMGLCMPGLCCVKAPSFASPVHRGG